MAGDLEDFLRRAAERRQAKAAQQPAAPKPARRPQYSNRRTERVVDAVEVIEEPVLAEVVDEHSLHLAERREKIEAAKKLAAQVEAEAANKLKMIKRGAPKSRASGVAPVLTGNTAEDLIQLLKGPDGVKKAVLLREILDRPEHRW